MGLEKYIEELLYDYECVTIPDFGAFLTRSYGFEVNKISGKFNPPRKELTFNSLLTSNDGVLINYFAKKNKIKYKKAQNLIQKEVKNWRKQLKIEPLYLENIGIISCLKNNKIQFEPFNRVNFDDASFGLKIFNKLPLYSPKKTRIYPITKSDTKLIFTLNNSKQKINSFLKYTAIFIVLISLSVSGIFIGDRYIQDQRVLNQQMAQRKIQKNIQSSTFNLGSLSSISLIVGDVEDNDEPLLNETHYSIIAGTFRNKSFAIRKIRNLKLEGFESSFTDLNPKGMFRVAYGRFKSKKEAMNLLYYVKYELGKEAWYLKEN